MKLKFFADEISMTEAYARPDKISKTELLLTIFFKKELLSNSYKELQLRLHRHPR